MANFKFIELQKHNNVKAGMLGFEKDGVIITNPDVDETGRFPVDYKEYYGLTKKQAEYMRKENLKKIPS